MNSTDRADHLLHLGRVPMLEQAVGDEVLVDGAEGGVLLQCHARARHAASGIDDDPGRVDDAPAHQRRERERRRRRIAARHRDRTRTDDRVAVQLGQPVHELRQELGTLVRLVVPLRVQLGIGQPEVSGQVDDRADLLAELGDDPLRGAVRQRQEDKVEPVARVGVVRREDEVRIGGREARVAGGGELARLALSGCDGDVEAAVQRAQAQQLCARVARGPDDPDPLADHERMIIRTCA